MVRFRRLILLALPVSLLSATMARGNESSSSSAPGITREDQREDQREERFYNFDNGRQSGGGFKDPSDLIRRLRNTRNLQYATDPAKTVDAALEDFVWPDESPPEEDSEKSEEVVEEVEEEEADNSTPPVTTP